LSIGKNSLTAKFSDGQLPARHDHFIILSFAGSNSLGSKFRQQIDNLDKYANYKTQPS